MEYRIKRKRIKGIKVTSSGSLKPYLEQEKILIAPQDDGEGVEYKKSK
jgi:hypothetical protein